MKREDFENEQAIRSTLERLRAHADEIEAKLDAGEAADMQRSLGLVLLSVERDEDGNLDVSSMIGGGMLLVGLALVVGGGKVAETVTDNGGGPMLSKMMALNAAEQAQGEEE